MNEKSSDSNLHFSMIADDHKLNNNIIEEINDNLSDTSENSNSNISDIDSNIKEKEYDLQTNNESKINDVSKTNNNVCNDEHILNHEKNNVNNLPKISEEKINSSTEEIPENDNIKTNIKTNINLDKFNLNNNTIEFEKLDDRAQKFKKMEKLAKLIEIKNRGFNLTKVYDMNSSYEEMCFEINYWTNYQKRKDGITLSKSFLMNTITGLEFLNDRYDPFGFKLNGWSEQIKINTDSYDDVMGELYEKYKSSGKKVEPEIKLLMMLSASAVTFHATKSISSSIPGLDNILNNNPDILNNLSTSINSNISGQPEQTYNQQQQQLYNNVKKQQADILKKHNDERMKEKNNSFANIYNNNNDITDSIINPDNMKEMLNKLKQERNIIDEENDNSSVEITSSSINSERKRKKSILKINT
tara:strand:- start:2281 stop:3525 length:1245 start_codon:yes stop_codon:yes gene_type:complete